MFDDGSASHIPQGQSVDFIAFTKIGTAMTDGNIAEYAWIIRIGYTPVSATRFTQGYAFNMILVIEGIQTGRPQQDDTSPASLGINPDRTFQIIILTNTSPSSR
jgi:hypothetical protein